jgi:hypothetical protein
MEFALNIRSSELRVLQRLSAPEHETVQDYFSA